MGDGKAEGSEDRVAQDLREEDVLAELARLKEEHRDLDDAIEALKDGIVNDQLQLQRLKKRKLVLRDRIAFIEDQLHPDIIA